MVLRRDRRHQTDRRQHDVDQEDEADHAQL
jgi:hypothetical protein